MSSFALRSLADKDFPDRDLAFAGTIPRLRWGGTPSGGCDYTKARVRHVTHAGATNIKSTVLESVKHPFENRIWYAYPGRGTLFTYANGIDLLAVTQITEGGVATVLGQYTYNYRRWPLSYVDAAGGLTTYADNASLTRLRAPIPATGRPAPRSASSL